MKNHIIKKLIIQIFLLLSLSLSAEEIIYLRAENNDSIPALYQCCAAIDSTGRFWASGIGIFDSKPLYSFDGESWTNKGVFEGVQHIIVDIHNNLWFFEMIPGANLRSYQDDLLTEYDYSTGSIGIDSWNGNFCFYGNPYPDTHDDYGFWEFQYGVMNNRFLRHAVFYFVFGFDGEYLCLILSGDYIFLETRDSIDIVVAGPDTILNDLSIPTQRSTMIYSKLDSSYFFVKKLNPYKHGILHYDASCIEIDTIDTCSSGRIDAIFEDSDGAFFYALHGSDCREDGVYMMLDDETSFIDHMDSTGRCHYIIEDPYTHNIWLCCENGFVIYNRDSVWFDIHEYSVEEKPQPIPKHEKLQIYPNPTRGKCHINGSIDNPVSVYNLNGRLIDKILPGSDYWDSEDQPAGIYLLETIGDSLSATSKVRKIK